MLNIGERKIVDSWTSQFSCAIPPFWESASKSAFTSESESEDKVEIRNVSKNKKERKLKWKKKKKREIKNPA